MAIVTPKAGQGKGVFGPDKRAVWSRSRKGSGWCPGPCFPHRLYGERRDAVDTFEQSTGVYALAVALAKSMSTEELTRTSLLLTQLSTTMATLAGLQNLEQSSSTQELADLSGLR